MTQFLTDEGSDSEEVITPLMLDGTYLSSKFCYLAQQGKLAHMSQACQWLGLGLKVEVCSKR